MFWVPSRFSDVLVGIHPRDGQNRWYCTPYTIFFLARIEEKIKAEAEIDAYEEGRRNRGDNMRQQRLRNSHEYNDFFQCSDRRQAGKRLVYGQRLNDNPELQHICE